MDFFKKKRVMTQTFASKLEALYTIEMNFDDPQQYPALAFLRECISNMTGKNLML